MHAQPTWHSTPAHCHVCAAAQGAEQNYQCVNDRTKPPKPFRERDIQSCTSNSARPSSAKLGRRREQPKTKGSRFRKLREGLRCEQSTSSSRDISVHVTRPYIPYCHRSDRHARKEARSNDLSIFKFVIMGGKKIPQAGRQPMYLSARTQSLLISNPFPASCFNPPHSSNYMFTPASRLSIPPLLPRRLHRLNNLLHHTRITKCTNISQLILLARQNLSQNPSHNLPAPCLRQIGNTKHGLGSRKRPDRLAHLHDKRLPQLLVLLIAVLNRHKSIHSLACELVASISAVLKR
jgi:hypothetical protein